MVRRRLASVCGSALADVLGAGETGDVARDVRVDGVGKSRSEPFVVDQLEAGQSLSLGGVTLSLRPDRIDRMDTGGRLIIDYKSRAPAKTHWLGKNRKSLSCRFIQLLDNDIEGIAFGEFSVTGPVRFVSLGERYAIASRDAQSLSSQTGGWLTIGLISSGIGGAFLIDLLPTLLMGGQISTPPHGLQLLLVVIGMPATSCSICS